MYTEVELAEIRRLNDQLRCRGIGGRHMITSGISTLSPDMLAKIMLAIACFDAFTVDNDPHGEHDCAVLTVEGVTVLWKIDYYDLTGSYHSQNPADPDVTVRVMTVMLAEEY